MLRQISGISWFAERWDIITRKAGDQRRGAQNCASMDGNPRRGSEWRGHQCHVNLPGAYTQLVRLVIIDESDPELNKIQIVFSQSGETAEFFLSCLAPSMIVFGA